MAADQSQTNQSSQVPYAPQSRGFSLETVMPANMSGAIKEALTNLEQRTGGSVDQYVAERLNFGSVENVHRVLAAEQVDGVALAVNAIETGGGAVIGDQTGVGKGRQVAAVLKYALETGRTPIFVTKDPSLYADIVRDLDDIGVKGFRPFITNGNEKIPLPDGREIKTSSNSHAKEMARLMNQGDLGESYDGIFTTYSQMQTVRGQETQRREFLRLFARGAILAMDESHEAGGSQGDDRFKARDAPPNRAQFARELVDLADGVIYASATYAKRPDVMDLYRRTNLRHAVEDAEQLGELINQGGIPLQQATASMLAADGQYLRREREYGGVDVQPVVVEVDKESTDDLSRIMAGILKFDRAKQDAVKDLDKAFKAQARKVSLDTTIGQAGAQSINFTSLMHNAIDQSLLARKADAIADRAVEKLEQNVKPFIAVSNTMGSFIEKYAKDNGLQPADPIDASFNDIMLRYLDRSRDIIVKDFAGQNIANDSEGARYRLTDAELGDEAVAIYKEVQALIEATDLSRMPISPIDHIRRRIEASGYSFGEITGRDSYVEYDVQGQA